MKDAYDNLFKKYPKDDFFNDGIDQIIFIDSTALEQNWKVQKEKLFNNEELFIRGYGRNASGTQSFIRLYEILFQNNNIKKDGSNNNKGTQLIAKLTGLSKDAKSNEIGIERIRNYQVSHLFGRTKNPLLFTAAWNIAYIPKYLDPFTGHETRGIYKIEFKNLFDKKIKSLFRSYIEDYNSIIDIQILPFLEDALHKTKEELDLDDKIFDKFAKDARKELSKIEL